MKTRLLNRAIANEFRTDEQRKAFFAKQGGAWSRAKEALGQLGRFPTPDESLRKLESDQRGRDALVRTMLSLTPVGAGVAIDDLMHSRTPGGAAMATLGALPFAGGLGDDASRLVMQTRRAELAAALRRDRALKRLDQHPELFRPSSPQEARLRETAARYPNAPAADYGYMGGGTIGERLARIDREAAAYQTSAAQARGARPGETLSLYGNRSPMSDEQRRAMFARKNQGGMAEPAVPAEEAKRRGRWLQTQARVAAGGGTVSEREDVLGQDIGPYGRTNFQPGNDPRLDKRLAALSRVYQTVLPSTRPNDPALIYRPGVEPPVNPPVWSMGDDARTVPRPERQAPVVATQSGISRIPVQPGRVGPVQGAQTPRGGTPVQQPGPPPQQGTQAYRDWLKQYAAWEQSQPGGALRPWGQVNPIVRPTR
jgi:hypothetical protein